MLFLLYYKFISKSILDIRINDVPRPRHGQISKNVGKTGAEPPFPFGKCDAAPVFPGIRPRKPSSYPHSVRRIFSANSAQRPSIPGSLSALPGSFAVSSIANLGGR